ncbi:MAG: ribonuclease E inhibitor RraB, partial [Sinobacteraceae bacterium]|nr:ribonuclease E inhibitor RraB [Nevskiaceae bacterium]
EGFSVDAKPMAEKTDLSYSLHAAKSMRLIVPDMQDLTRRMNELAARYQGRYDGWTA